MFDFKKDYKILNIDIAETRTGKAMAKLNLKSADSDNVLNAVIWQESLNNIDKSILKPGNTVRVFDGSYNTQYNNLSINDIRLVKEAKNGLDQQERTNFFNKILEEVESFQEENLKATILQFLFENADKIKTAPAATKLHHNYLGGLLQHISECIDIAKANISVIPTTINQDLVIAGCIMHDIGKIFEYSLNEETFAISKNKDFQKVWINHIQWGFCWANKNGLSELAHIIASHHGIREWNALVEPMTNEAVLVHQVDMISSRLGLIQVDQLESNNQLSRG